jgi:hypothetical protein
METMTKSQHLQSIEEEKATAAQQCAEYLTYLKSSVYNEEGDETIDAEFIETYKRYIDALRVQYPSSAFLNVIDQIPVFPNLNSHYWRIFFSFTWNALDRDQKQSLFNRFPSMKEYEWLLECDPLEMIGSSSITPTFLPKAVAVAVKGMLTDRYESVKLQKATLLDDLMWIDYNFDLRDYGKIYRDIDGWGIIFSTDTPKLLEDIHYEYSVERIESLLRCSVSLDEETKRRIILTYTDIPFENVQALVEILENEIKGCFMFESKLQNTQLVELVEVKSQEWQEILNDYGRE